MKRVDLSRFRHLPRIPSARIWFLLALLTQLRSHASGAVPAFQQMRLGDYSFRLIASTNDEIRYLDFPKLANSGAIAYSAVHSDESAAIYYADDTGVRKLIGSGYSYGGGTFDYIGPFIDMNNDGLTAFSTNKLGTAIAPVYGVFTITPEGLLTRVSQTDLFTRLIHPGMSLNDAGDIAYVAETSSDSMVYATTANGLEIIYHQDDFNRSPTSPVINESRAVAFGGQSSSFGVSEEMYVYAGGRIDVIEPGPFTVAHEMSPPDLNNSGDIAYVRERHPVSFAYPREFHLMLYRDGQLNELRVTDAQPYGVHINNRGVIAYLAITDAESFGAMQTYFNGVTKRVLGSGDIVFGKVTNLVEAYDFNDRDQMALRVWYEDGSWAIILASPVPEPASQVLMLGVLAVGCPFRRRHGDFSGDRMTNPTSYQLFNKSRC